MRSFPHPTEAAGSRIEPLAILPVFLDLTGRRCLVAGGSDAAAWKADLLAAAGAAVALYSAQPSEAVLDVVARGRLPGSIRLHHRPWCEADFAGAALAVATDDVEGGAEAFARAAHAAGALVNIIDRPSLCDIQFGAIVNRSPVVIGISTAGACPILAQAIRGRIEMLLPLSISRWVQAAGRVRDQLRRRLPDSAVRRRFWEWFVDAAFVGASSCEIEASLLARAASLAGNRSGMRHLGSATLFRVAPGDPELLTLKAIRAMQRADVILFDDQVAPEILQFARREAKRMSIGMPGSRNDVTALVTRLAREGKHVVRLESGDPLLPTADPFHRIAGHRRTAVAGGRD